MRKSSLTPLVPLPSLLLSNPSCTLCAWAMACQQFLYLQLLQLYCQEPLNIFLPSYSISSLSCTLCSFSSLSIINMLSPHLFFVIVCSHHLVCYPWLPCLDDLLSTLIAKTPFPRTCSHKVLQSGFLWA